MPNEINLNTTQTATSPLIEQFQKLSGDSTKAKEVISKALEVLAGANVKVTRSDSTGTDGVAEKKTNGATSVPSLDNPADPKQMEANLEKLIAFLQLDNEKRQTAMAKDRIEMQKDNLKTEHDGRMKEIKKTLDKMDQAQKAQLANRIFGWLGAIISVFSAIAVTIATGGAAAAFAIAGAALAVTSLTLNETGAMEIITKKFSEHMQEKYGWSKEKADLFASLTINLGMMALQLGCSAGALFKAVSSVPQTFSTIANIARTAQTGLAIGGLALSGVGLVSGGVSTYMTNRSQKSQADVTELEKFLQQLQQQLDETEEELQQLLQLLQNGIGQVASIITSATDTSAEISRKIGAMA